jgi:MerR family mercuric resistance operon transcriptional regulator
MGQQLRHAVGGLQQAITALRVHASSLAEHKLKDVREKMADLARMEAVLSELVCACHARRGNVSCPLIASLQGGASLAGSAMP